QGLSRGNLHAPPRAHQFCIPHYGPLTQAAVPSVLRKWFRRLRTRSGATSRRAFAGNGAWSSEAAKGGGDSCNPASVAGGTPISKTWAHGSWKRPAARRKPSRGAPAPHHFWGIGVRLGRPKWQCLPPP